MKRYLASFALFSLIAVAVFGGWAAALLFAEIRAYGRESHMPDDVRFVVCGDSQTEVGLIPHLWPGFFNFSISSLQLDQVELKVIDLLERNPGFRGTVILDLSPMKLFAQDIDKSMLVDRSAGKRFLLHALHPDKSRRPLDGIVVLFRDSILVKRTTKALKSFRLGIPYISSIGGPGAVRGLTEEQAAANLTRFMSMPTQRGFFERPDLVESGLREGSAELERWPLVTDESKSVRCFRDILAFIKARGATPVVITTPVHPRLLALMPREKLANFKAMCRKLTDEAGVRYFDYLEAPFDDDDWRDGNHLNARGAAKLTMRVRRDIEGIPAEPGHQSP